MPGITRNSTCWRPCSRNTALATFRLSRRIALASRRVQMYLRCGFGGNPAGATYYLDNFWLAVLANHRGVLLDSSQEG